MSKILAIDDQKDNLITISALLKNLIPGCTVLTAQEGEEGIGLAKSELPDVIILDIKMPGMDGFEVCTRLKGNADTKHIPVVLLTAIHTDMESRVRGLDIGADAFLTKPINEAELIAQINVMLRIKKAEDLLRSEKLLLEEIVQERTGELMESQRKLIKERDFIRSLEDASPAYYVALDTDGNVLIMNRALIEAAGRDLDEVKGRSYFDTFVPDEERETALRQFAMLKESRRARPHEETILAADGELLVEWHGSPFYRKDGTLEYIFYVGIDITERKRLERVLMSENQKERSRIGQDLHDTIGQHLAGIAFKSEILRLKMKEKLPEELGSIDDIVGLVSRAIDQTRNLARGLCPVDMTGGGLMAALDELRTEVEEQFGVSCVIRGDRGVQFQEEFEASNLYYIIREAVNNAVKHGSAKNIIVALSRDDRIVRATVTDDGIGIPEGFDDAGGMGINIMRYRAWVIGANLSIYRNDGGGTVVMCELRQSGEEVFSSLEENIRDMYIHGSREGKRGILVVDDHAIVRQGVAEIINSQKDLFVCGEAENAEDAVAMIPRVEPDLLVADVSLAGTSGIDLTRALKNRYPELPVLMLSIYDETLYGERAIKAGARGYVMKDQAPDTLITAIRTVLRGEKYLSEKMKRTLMERITHDGLDRKTASIDSLTDREFEIFQQIGHGYSNRHIADQLKISVKTVENYREKIKNKLNMGSSADLVRFAVEWVIEGVRDRKG